MLTFTMSAVVAEEFFRRCIEQEADTEEARVEILLNLVEEEQIKSVAHTNRTPEQFVKDLAKNFGPVLYVRPKEGDL